MARATQGSSASYRYVYELDFQFTLISKRDCNIVPFFTNFNINLKNMFFCDIGFLRHCSILSNFNISLKNNLATLNFCDIISPHRVG